MPNDAGILCHGDASNDLGDAHGGHGPAMERSDSRLLPLVALNERRRRAVALRLSGMKLK
jgi:hypothetical protein